jgi:hypothetical protein
MRSAWLEPAPRLATLVFADDIFLEKCANGSLRRALLSARNGD